MSVFRWNELKSERLKRTRGVSFDEITKAKFLGIARHPNRVWQRFLLFEHRGYVWVVPCIQEDDSLFLKTLYPSRKYTKLYRRDQLK